MGTHLPPLRERRGATSLLTGHFSERFNRKLGRRVQGVSAEAVSALVRHDWPGNVRELENVLERAVLLAEGRVIGSADLPAGLTSREDVRPESPPEDSLSIKRASRRLERDLIRKALALTGGNRSQAARVLEISRPVLLNKIREYGLE